MSGFVSDSSFFAAEARGLGSIPRAEREKVGIFDGLVRLSVRIEACSDLKSDLDQALERAGLGPCRSGAAE